MSSIAIFVGPSLPITQAKSIQPNAQFYPPVKLGDIVKAVDSGVETIVIIDGVFELVPAVWHKEILLALEANVRVIGASSMGALRASELSCFNMEGVGWVYQQYENGLEDDDEVALLHTDDKLNYVNLSIPLITLRYIVEKRILSNEANDILRLVIDKLKLVFYPKRTIQFVTEIMNEMDVAKTRQDEILTVVSDPSYNIKRLDALEAINASMMTDNKKQNKSVEYSVFLQKLMQQRPTNIALKPTEMLPKALALLHAKHTAGSVDPKLLQKELKAWQLAKGLKTSQSAQGFLMRRGLTQHDLLTYLKITVVAKHNDDLAIQKQLTHIFSLLQ